MAIEVEMISPAGRVLVSSGQVQSKLNSGWTLAAEEDMPEVVPPAPAPPAEKVVVVNDSDTPPIEDDVEEDETKPFWGT